MSVERALHCGLYLPGHEVHWIQARKSAEIESKHIGPGELLEVKPDGTVVVAIGMSVFQLWNHEPRRLGLLVARNSGEVHYDPEFHLLRTPSEGGSFVFCMADHSRHEVRACPEHPPTGSPIELLKEAGGFMMPAPEALKWLRGELDD